MIFHYSTENKLRHSGWKREPTLNIKERQPEERLHPVICAWAGLPSIPHQQGHPPERRHIPLPCFLALSKDTKSGVFSRPRPIVKGGLGWFRESLPKEIFPHQFADSWKAFSSAIRDWSLTWNGSHRLKCQQTQTVLSNPAWVLFG